MSHGRRHYFKVWREWYVSEQHACLGGDALNLGPTLMYLAWSGPGAGPWLLRPDETPMAVMDIASRCRWPSRRVASALAELLGISTLVRREGDLAIGFSPESWERYQGDTKWAEYKRNRSKDKSGNVIGMSNGESKDKDWKQGGRVESRELRIPPVAPQGAPRPKRPRPPDPSDDDVAQILAALNAARERLGFEGADVRDTPANRKSIAVPYRECRATLADWLDVIAKREYEASISATGRKFFALQTMGRPDNFERSRSAESRRSGSQKPGSTTLVDVHRPDETEVF